MPYLGREPQGILANTIEGNLKVTGTISADSINDKVVLNGSDSSSPQSNANDQIVLEAGTLDDATHSSVVPAMAATDNLLLEDVTPSQAEVSVANIAAAGTSGQVLQSQGSLVTPPFGDVSSGLTKISSQDATGANVQFTSSHFANSTYSGYQFHLHNIATSSDSDRLYVNTSTDGGSTYESTYAWVVSEWNTNTGVNLTKDSNEGSTHLQLGLDSNVGSATNETFSGIFNLFNPGATQYTQMTWHCCYDDDQAGVYFTHTLGCGKRPSAADVDGIKFFFGNDFAGSGKITMYGLQA